MLTEKINRRNAIKATIGTFVSLMSFNYVWADEESRTYNYEYLKSLTSDEFDELLVQDFTKVVECWIRGLVGNAQLANQIEIFNDIHIHRHRQFGYYGWVETKNSTYITQAFVTSLPLEKAYKAADNDKMVQKLKRIYPNDNSLRLLDYAVEQMVYHLNQEFGVQSTRPKPFISHDINAGIQL